MGKLLGCLAVLLVGAGIVVFFVFYWTGDVTRAADQMFVLIRDGRAGEAYRSTAREFQAATSEDDFLAFLKNSTLTDYRGAKWYSRSVSGSTGELEGDIQTAGGGVIPIKIKLVKESGAWKVLVIEKALAGLRPKTLQMDSVSAGLGADAVTPQIPPPEELAALADDSVMLLGRAVNTGDFSEFHKSISRMWQNQTTGEALLQAFQPLIDQKIDLTQVEGKIPEFTQNPAIDDSGRLILTGRYSLPSGTINFTVKFVSENLRWKLIGMYASPESSSVNPAATAGTGIIPPESELDDMAGRSIKLLASAIQRDDYTDFYASIAKLWQNQTSREKLRDQFRVFVDRKISLDLIEGTAPVFSESPVIDGNRVLLLTGYYPTRPYRVDFKLKFIREGSEWKLIGIDVSTTGGK